jgi:hypothetical protein
MSARELDRSDWEQEGPDRDVRIVTLGSKVLAASICFFFGGFFFAFIYLRLQNVNDRWNHIDVEPSMPLAITVLVATVLAAGLLLSLRGHHPAHELGSWRARGLVVLLLILVAIVARIVQLWTLGVDPASSGYVAVVIGWSASLVAVEIGALYWAQTLAARAGRLARTAADPASGAGERELADAEARFDASASSFTLFWFVLTGVEIVAFVLLDVVR